jgi:WD40 repeat protein
MKHVLLFTSLISSLSFSCFGGETEPKVIHPLERVEKAKTTEGEVTFSKSRKLKAELTKSRDSIVLYSSKSAYKLSWTAVVKSVIDTARETIGILPHPEEFYKDAELSGNGQPISHLEISPNERLLLASTAHGVMLFDIKRRKLITTFNEKSWNADSAIHELSNAVFVGDNLILSVQQYEDFHYGTNYKVAGFRLWDIATKKQISDQSLTVRNAQVTATNISASGKTIMGFENNTVINKINLHPLKPINISKGAEKPAEDFFTFEPPIIIKHVGKTAHNVHLSPDGNIAKIEYREEPGTEYQWDIRGKEPVKITE